MNRTVIRVMATRPAVKVAQATAIQDIKKPTDEEAAAAEFRSGGRPRPAPGWAWVVRTEAWPARPWRGLGRAAAAALAASSLAAWPRSDGRPRPGPWGRSSFRAAAGPGRPRLRGGRAGRRPRGLAGAGRSRGGRPAAPAQRQFLRQGHWPAERPGRAGRPSAASAGAAFDRLAAAGSGRPWHGAGLAAAAGGGPAGPGRRQLLLHRQWSAQRGWRRDVRAGVLSDGRGSSVTAACSVALSSTAATASDASASGRRPLSRPVCAGPPLRAASRISSTLRTFRHRSLVASQKPLPDHSPSEGHSTRVADPTAKKCHPESSESRRTLNS